MSEIRATTISDSAGTGPITLTKQSAAKAWCKLINKHHWSYKIVFNLSSITDDGNCNNDLSYTSSLQMMTIMAKA